MERAEPPRAARPPSASRPSTSASGLERLECINSCGWLNCPLEARFDRVTQMLSQVFKCPVSCCTLIAQDRVWIKSLVGAHGDEISRFDAFGNYICVPPTPQVLVTEDASQDSRFAHNPYVKGAPYMKFFAAAPVVGAGGTRYGTLCVMDYQKRSFSQDTYKLLANCAELVVMELEKSKGLLDSWCVQALTHQRASRALHGFMDSAPNGVALLDTRRAAWEVKYVNSKFAATCCEPAEDLVGTGFWHGFSPMDETSFSDITETSAEAAVLRLDVKCNKTGAMFTIVLRPASSNQMTPGQPLGMPSWLPCWKSLAGGPSEVAYLGLGKCLYLAVIEPQEQKSLWKITSRRPSGPASQFGSLHSGCSQMAADADMGDLDPDPGPGSLLSNSSSSWSYGDFSPPSDIGRLELGPLIGAGGFGKVYRGLWNQTQVVAVKVLQCFTRENLDAGTHEAELGLHLSHWNVVKTHRLGSKKEQLYEPKEGGGVEVVDNVTVLWMIQEYCEWGTLNDAVERGTFCKSRSMPMLLNEPKLYLTLMDIAAGMTHIHASGIIHCDLNGRNVMLQQCGDDSRGFVAKVADFGLARLSHDTLLSNRLAGTISHIPPEQFKHGHTSMAGDVWAFGVLMWEAFTGRRAYEDRDSSDIVAAVSLGQERLQLHESAPRPYREIVAACLQDSPDARPSFHSILQMLQRAHQACQ